MAFAAEQRSLCLKWEHLFLDAGKWLEGGWEGVGRVLGRTMGARVSWGDGWKDVGEALGEGWVEPGRG